VSGLYVEHRGSARWLAFWEATGHEPFAHPEFGRLFAAPDDETVAVCWEDGGGRVLLPLVLRAVPEDVPAPAVDGLTDGWRDAVSPYGYGGPFVSGDPDLTAFYAALLARMRDDRVLSAFVRGTVVGPVVADPMPDGVRAVHLADNVVVGLGVPAEERWRRYEHKVRKNVNKARRNGVTTTVSDVLDDPEGFAEVYGTTMQRRAASAFYRFDADFFASLGQALAGSYWVADTRAEDGTVVSTELVLRSDRTCYSFLGGTRQEAFSMSPNDLLKHDVIEHAAASGLEHYVLGGGYQPGDGIFRYKKAFDPTGIVPFHGIQLVPDAGAYEVACSAAGVADVSFFPRYRADSA
jgi:CelD/BcsL family acetyltransferase involved in cellulose biosynthesis